MKFILGTVAGDWTDFTTPAKTSLSQSNSIPLLTLDQTNGFMAQKRKERGSRMFSSVSESHAKLKRHSSANTPVHIGKDQEDSCAIKETIVAGSIQSLCYTYSYTKKGGM